MKRFGCCVLILVMTVSLVSQAQPTDAGVPLWPFYYQSDDGRHVEVAASLYGRHDENRHLGPVFWGENYTVGFPFYWKNQEGWKLIPLAWNTGGHKGVGPVWWGKDYLHVFPLFWKNQDEWVLFPVAGHDADGVDWAGPFWRNQSGSNGLFPFYWRSQKGWTLLPLAWKRDDRHGVLPLYWSWTGQDQAHRSIIPPLLGWTETKVEEKQTRALLGMINYTKNQDGHTFEF